MKIRSRDFLLGAIVATICIMSFGGGESVADKEPDRVVDVVEYLDYREDLKDSIVEMVGNVSYIRYTDTGIALTLDKRVSCYFSGSDADSVIDIKVGDKVKIKGISTMNYDGMPELNNCAIK